MSGVLINPYAVATPVLTVDDEFSGSALDPKWEWYNRATASASVSGGQLTLTGPGDTSMPAYLTQDVSYLVGNWAITARMGGTYNQAGGSYMGVVAYNPANAHRATAMFIPVRSAPSSGNAFVQRREGTNFVVNLGSFFFPLTTMWLRIALTGSTLTFWTSTDGTNFDQRASETLAAHLGAVGRVGFFLGGLVGTAGVATSDWVTRT